MGCKFKKCEEREVKCVRKDNTAIEDRSYKIKEGIARARSIRKKWGRPSVIEASATLHQYQREVVEIEGKQYLIAGVRDFKIAKNLCQEVLAQTPRGITKDSERISEICKELADEEQEEFTRAMLQARSGYPLTTLKRHLEPLVDKGYLQVIEGGKDVAYRYKLTMKDPFSAGLEQIRLNDSTVENLTTWPNLAKGSTQVSQISEKTIFDHLTTEERGGDE